MSLFLRRSSDFLLHLLDSLARALAVVSMFELAQEKEVRATCLPHCFPSAANSQTNLITEPRQQTRPDFLTWSSLRSEPPPSSLAGLSTFAREFTGLIKRTASGSRVGGESNQRRSHLILALMSRFWTLTRLIAVAFRLAPLAAARLLPLVR